MRLTSCGTNRLAVLAKARSLLQQPPAEVKAALDGGRPVVLAVDIGRSRAESLAAELRRLGASVDIFVSIPCPSGSGSHGERA